MHLLLPCNNFSAALIPPGGISREQAEYLHKEIREFCQDGTEDFVAPPIPLQTRNFVHFTSVGCVGSEFDTGLANIVTFRAQ